MRVKIPNSIKALSAFLAVILISGCQGSSSSWNSSEGFKTQIVSASSGGSSFQVVTLEGVQDQKTLAGLVADYFYAPGEVGQNVKGQAPIARFVKTSDGVHVPADMTTLQMVTIYYHLQELKKIEFAVSEKGLVTWPRKVGLRVQATDPIMKFNNAFYSNQTDMLYFVPYKNQATPIPLNPGVIAHELFHSYFAAVVTAPLYGPIDTANSKKLKIKNSQEAENLLVLDYYIKSVNEGLADFWGWLYTQDPDFVALSLPTESDSRSLEKAQIQFKLASDSVVRAKARGYANGACGQNSPTLCTTSEGYRNGTVLARTLRTFALSIKAQKDLSSLEVQKIMAAKVISLLSAIRQNMSDENFSLEKVITDWGGLFESLNENQCESLKSVLDSSEAKAKLCP